MVARRGQPRSPSEDQRSNQRSGSVASPCPVDGAVRAPPRSSGAPGCEFFLGIPAKHLPIQTSHEPSLHAESARTYRCPAMAPDLPGLGACSAIGFFGASLPSYWCAASARSSRSLTAVLPIRRGSPAYTTTGITTMSCWPSRAPAGCPRSTAWPSRARRCRPCARCRSSPRGSVVPPESVPSTEPLPPADPFVAFARTRVVRLTH